MELLLGTTPVFVFAGLVEGFISPSGLPLGVKLALGPLLWLAWAALVYLLGPRRRPASPLARGRGALRPAPGA